MPFGEPQCTDHERPAPDMGQGQIAHWRRPGQNEVAQAVGQVGYQIPNDARTQIRNQRVSAGMPQSMPG